MPAPVRVNHVIAIAGVVWTKMQDFALIELEHPGYSPQTELVDIFL